MVYRKYCTVKYNSLVFTNFKSLSNIPQTKKKVKNIIIGHNILIKKCTKNSHKSKTVSFGPYEAGSRRKHGCEEEDDENEDVGESAATM